MVACTLPGAPCFKSRRKNNNSSFRDVLYRRGTGHQTRLRTRVNRDDLPRYAPHLQLSVKGSFPILYKAKMRRHMLTGRGVLRYLPRQPSPSIQDVYPRLILRHHQTSGCCIRERIFAPCSPQMAPHIFARVSLEPPETDSSRYL